MVFGAPENDLFKFGVYRYTVDATVTVDVGVSVVGLTVREGTMKVGVIQKRVDCVGCSGQKVTSE